MDEMSVEKWWNEICGRGKLEKPREKPTQTPFRPPRNPHGGAETRTRDPSGGRRAPNRLRHEAAPDHYLVIAKLRDKLSVAKRVDQIFDIDRFDVRTLKDEEIKLQ